MLDVGVLGIIGLEQLKLERGCTAALGIQAEFLESAHVHRDVKAELDLDLVQRLDFGVFDCVARLDRTHVVFVVDALKRDEIRRSMLATDCQRRLLQCTRSQRFHEALGTDAKDVLVDFLVCHEAAVHRFSDLDVAFKATLVGERKVGIVCFHTKARKCCRFDKCEADLLDRVRDGLHELAQQDAVCKGHFEEEIRTGRHGCLCNGLCRHCAGINLLVGDDDALGTLGGRLAVLGFGITRRDEGILLVIRSIRAFRRALARTGSFVIYVGLLLQRHFRKSFCMKAKE